MKTLDVAGLREVAAGILCSAGASDENAFLVAEHLVEAEMMGRLSHALRLLPEYVNRLRLGRVDGVARPEITHDMGATLRISGNGGFGQVAGDFAADAGIARSRQCGVSLVALRDSGHLGRNGRWPERAAAQGVASLHFGHSARGPDVKDIVVPFGGAAARLRASPLAFGAPAQSGRPVILDFACGEYSANAIKLAAERKVALPTPALIDSDGRATDDATLFVQGLAGVQAFGGFKGYGLAVFVEILAGVIASDGNSTSRRNSLLSVYIDVRSQRGWSQYNAELEALLEHIRSTPPAADGDGVRIPGERNPARVAQIECDGVPAERRVVEVLQRAAQATGREAELTRRWPDVFSA